MAEGNKLQQVCQTLRGALGQRCCGGKQAFTDHGSDSDTEGEGAPDKFVEVHLLRHDLNAEHNYPDNSIRTARYTLLSGLPLALHYQFRKISNVYFLLVMIISLIPGASPINPISSVAPLCIVLGAGIIKDLWEDWKRQKADRKANAMTVQVLRNGEFAPVRSMDVRPGDVMLFRLGEEVRADCLILNTSLPDGLTYIETANLDGETNAKTRRAKVRTVELLGTVEDIVELAVGDPSTSGKGGSGGTGGVGEKVRASRSCCGGGGGSSSARGPPMPAKDGGETARKGALPLDTCSIRSDGFSGLQLDGEPPDAVVALGAPRALPPPHHRRPDSIAEGAGERDALPRGDQPTTHGRGGGSRARYVSVGGEDSGMAWPACEERSADAGAAGGGTHLHPQHSRGSSAVEPPPWPTVVHGARSHSAGLDGLSGGHGTPVPRPISRIASLMDVAHARQPTLDERMELEGSLPVPREIAQLSRMYESREHLRSASGLHLWGGRSLTGGSAAVSARPTPQETALCAGVGGGGAGAGVVLLGSAPSPDLATWYGQVRVAATAEMISVGIEQFLPRGCIVRNTEWVLGAVLYTGSNTKMLLNLRPKPNKITRMTRRLNILNVFLFIINQCAMFILCGLAVYQTKHMRHKPADTRSAWTHWYLEWNLHRYSSVRLFWWRYLTNFVLLSYLIPMSLYVTLEFNKAMQMLMIARDKRMAVFDEFTGELKKCRPKTSELNCQLGQVEYIFTDKTGTLTENLMTYVGGFAAGITHDERERPGGLGKIMYRRLEAGGGAGRSSASYGGGDWDAVPGLGTLGGSGLAEVSGAAAAAGSSAFPHSTAPFSTAEPPPPGQAHADRDDVEGARASLTGGLVSLVDGRGAGAYPHTVTFPSLASASEALPQPQLRRIANMEEAALEKDDLFCYLRALALCHSIVCFEGAPADAPGAGDKDKGKRKRKSKEKAKRKRKSTTGKARDGKTSRKNAHADRKEAAPDPRGGGGRVAHEPVDSPGQSAAIPGGQPATTTTTHPHHRRARSTSAASPAEVAALRTSIRTLEQHAGNVVHVATAVPAGPDDRRLDKAPATNHRSPSGGNLAPHGTGNALRPHRRSASAPAHRRTGSVAHLVADTAAAGQFEHRRTLSVSRLLHGRTGSASWYYNRYNASAHQHVRTATGSRTLGGVSGAAPGAGDGLKGYIDRSKIYEGQSLDEIALVSAARENGFTLLRRTAKQMFIKVHESTLCYDIIAELEFTPQRKLMSILLHRNPAGDSAEAVAAAASAGNAHYHRDRAPTPPGCTSEEAAGSTSEPFAGEDGSPATTPTPPLLARSDVGAPPGAAAVGRTAAGSHASHPAMPPRHEAAGASLGGPRTPAAAAAAAAAAASVADDKFPYLLLTKGADSSMMTILDPSHPRNAILKPVLTRELDEMASQGLRTLVLGQRYLTEAQVREWLPVYAEAQCAMANRSERLHEAYALLETHINLVGTTAVEDKLQEGVPETLEFLSAAGIVVWMLTGDKRETAVTIAVTSGLVNPDHEDCVRHLDIADLLSDAAAQQMAAGSSKGKSGKTGRKDHVSTAEEPTSSGSADLQLTSGGSGEPFVGGQGATGEAAVLSLSEMRRVLEEQMAAAERLCDERAAEDSNEKVAVIVVDGRTLSFIFDDNDLAHRFFILGSRCRSAVCCRMTPLQKAQIVRMFQKNMKAIALAIGDGANDVSMIQESKIGVGIMGLEGSQAELASDYAIPKFRFLKRLLMVHGRFSIFRDSHCILYSLYKNVVLTVGMMAYTFLSGFSGQAFVDSWLLAMFSIFFCSLQPLMIGILDKDVEDELAESLPQLYPPLAKENMYFSYPYIIKWLTDGLVEGTAFFLFLIYTCARKDDLYPVKSGGIEDYGETFFTMLVLVVDLRVGVLVTFYTVLFWIAVTAEVALLPVFEIFYSSLHNLAGSNWCLYTAHSLYSNGKFYLFLLFAVGVMIVYTISTSLYIQMFAPWQNAGLAMMAARRSPYRRLHHEEKARLKREYRQRVGTFLITGDKEAAADDAQRRERFSERPGSATGGAPHD